MRQARSRRLIVVATRGAPCCSVLWKDYANMLRTNYTQKQSIPNRQGKLMAKIVLENQCGICRAGREVSL